jgi:hypothetical protein
VRFCLSDKLINDVVDPLAADVLGSDVAAGIEDAERIPISKNIAKSVHAGDWMPRFALWAGDGRRTKYRESLKSLFRGRWMILESRLR